MTSLADELPRQQARVRKLIEQYQGAQRMFPQHNCHFAIASLKLELERELALEREREWELELEPELEPERMNIGDIVEFCRRSEMAEEIAASVAYLAILILWEMTDRK